MNTFYIIKLTLAVFLLLLADCKYFVTTNFSVRTM